MRTLLEEIFTGPHRKGKCNISGGQQRFLGHPPHQIGLLGVYVANESYDGSRPMRCSNGSKPRTMHIVGRMSGTARMLLQVEVSLQLSEIVVFDMALDPTLVWRNSILSSGFGEQIISGSLSCLVLCQIYGIFTPVMTY